MKEIISDRLDKVLLDKVSDSTQKKLLKGIIEECFLELHKYQENKNMELEKRVFNEVVSEEDDYDIYTAVLKRSGFLSGSSSFYALDSEDVNEAKLDSGIVYDRYSRKENIKLFSVFMKCDYLKIKELIDGKHGFKGEIITDKKSIPVEVSLVQNRKYLDKIEKLYNAFLVNNIRWKTVNNPYASKFFDCILTKWGGTLEKGEKVCDVKVHLGEFNSYKMDDTLLVWNIEELKLKSVRFPKPVIDKINYEHYIDLVKHGIENGFIVEGETSVSHVRRTKEELCIASAYDKAREWNVYKIAQPGKESGYYEKYLFEPASNCTEKSFIGSFAQKNASNIRTRAEIKRIVHSFEASKYFELEDVEIGNSKSENSLTYDMNYFMCDDIRRGYDKKIMKLKFRHSKGENFITYDLLSFIISEVQYYFPDYICEGVLI